MFNIIPLGLDWAVKQLQLSGGLKDLLIGMLLQCRILL